MAEEGAVVMEGGEVEMGVGGREVAEEGAVEMEGGKEGGSGGGGRGGGGGGLIELGGQPPFQIV